jgi:carboxypeptidase C (cathepsin A)
MRIYNLSHLSPLETYSTAEDIGKQGRGLAGVLSDARDPEAHRVTSLPGLHGFTSAHYAGYITIDKLAGSNIFYWFFEAAINPAARPLVIWLNGGPGCSSMDGQFIELGPIRMSKNGPVMNPHSW